MAFSEVLLVGSVQTKRHCKESGSRHVSTAQKCGVLCSVQENTTSGFTDCCVQVAILSDDDCLQLDGGNGGGDFTRIAAECFGRDRTSVALLPAGASAASDSVQVTQGRAGIESRPDSMQQALSQWRPDARLWGHAEGQPGAGFAISTIASLTD